MDVFAGFLAEVFENGGVDVLPLDRGQGAAGRGLLGAARLGAGFRQEGHERSISGNFHGFEGGQPDRRRVALDRRQQHRKDRVFRIAGQDRQKDDAEVLGKHRIQSADRSDRVRHEHVADLEHGGVLAGRIVALERAHEDVRGLVAGGSDPAAHGRAVHRRGDVGRQNLVIERCGGR